MKKLITFITSLFLGTNLALADPHIFSDPDPTGASDLCVYSLAGGPATPTPVVNGGCYIDIAGVPVGQNQVEVWFESSVWGVTSVKVPFVFTRPAADGQGPVGISIIK